MIAGDDRQPKVKKLYRHRSLERQRHPSIPARSQSTKIIHTTIRSFNNKSFADNKSLAPCDDIHSVTNLTTDDHQNKIPRRTVSVTSLRRHRRSVSQRSQNKWRNDNLNRVTPRRDDQSLKSSKTLDSRSDRIGVVQEHHNHPNQKKKKKCPHLCIILSAIIGFVLIITIIIVLTVILTKPKATSTQPANIELRWNSSGTTVAGVLGQPGIAADHLTTPFGVAIDYNNTLYITDYGCHRVQRWPMGASTGTTVAGQANCTYGISLSQLISPAGILLDSDNNLYIADSGNSRILFWPKDATSGRMIAGNGVLGNLSHQLYTSFGISMDWNSNTLYVADFGNQRIMRYASNAASGDVVAGGNGVGINSTQLFYPTSVYFESLSNSLLIVNHLANNVVRWKLGENSWTIVAGSTNLLSGMTSTLLYGPIGITLDPMGNLYVADRFNHRVQLFLSSQSTSTTIAGVTNVFGNSSTLLNNPYTVALDSQLNLYVADTSNHRIQKFVRY